MLVGIATTKLLANMILSMIQKLKIDITRNYGAKKGKKCIRKSG